MSTKSVKFRFLWIIENVTREKLNKYNFAKYSETFDIEFSDIKTNWQLLLWEKKKGNLGVYVKNNDQLTGHFHVKLSAIDHITIDKDVPIKFNYAGWDNFFSFEDLFNPVLKHIDEKNRLKLNFEVAFSYEVNSKALVEVKPVETVILSNYGDSDFTDFTLTSSDGKDFPIHRVFLADRSEFFKKMFTIDMKEKRAASVTFEDVNSATLQEVIKFIYTGKVEVTDDKMTKDLLYAAEKFGLAGLKSYCIDMLVKNVKTESALETLKIADMFNAKELEEKCLETIMDNYQALEEQITDDWISHNISLMKKITKAFASNRTITLLTLQSSL